MLLKELDKLIIDIKNKTLQIKGNCIDYVMQLDTMNDLVDIYKTGNIIIDEQKQLAYCKDFTLCNGTKTKIFKIIKE